MKIGFVAEPYEEEGASGMGYMVRELVEHLPVAGAAHEFTIYSATPIAQGRVSVPFRNVIVPASFVGKLWWFLTTRERIDALVFVTPLLPLIVPRRIQTILLCPELVSQKITPGSFSQKVVAYVRDQILMPRCLARAAHVITISEATKQDVVRYYHVAPERITVSYVGYQDLTVFANRAPAIDEAMRPYFFFTGRVKRRKNVHAIVSAFVQFMQQTNADCKLVIAGKTGGEYKAAMEKELAENGLLDKVYFLGFVSSEMLYALYAHALAFVFPSLNEGFGMPVVEAMNVGTPVITSSISSLPEAAGDAGILVDPESVDAIAEAMGRLYRDEALRAELREKGMKQAQKFSWSKMAGEMIALIETYAR